ncbi:MAG: PBP1A family penicillin-binding protein [Candidatus Abyssobacteria bacterium SURF_5]|uniref:PBP1A family penicillin-binding protein n=1 Tax=Abyssobacteria bacterium (strain SURF_5) TaxID=2093360 RepID=A0A3A4NJT6_ABYX5|nr:MAG: PBP1A family penicillin-binding protein [Candidatus Abyssubacteria bacterium SURF_5]
MKKKSRRYFEVRRLLAWGCAVFGAACVILIIYCLFLSLKIEKRFSGRRWSIPSKVFSDSTIVYPGQRINSDLFLEKLEHLGYRKVFHSPQRKGEMRISDDAIEIFLHDFDLPPHRKSGFAVRIGLHENEFGSIVNLKTQDFLPILELEPEEIATLFGLERERRQLISIEQAPRHLIGAVVSAEDKRFYDHNGIDPRGMARAFFANLDRGAVVQGGSTITQQLAKCYFLYHERTIVRKLKEILISLVVELKYTKDEILEMYLNEIYLGQKGAVSINGVGEASFFYFGKPVDELSVSEAASIGGLIKAPNRYSPYVDKEKCREQRDRVLHAMFDNGWIFKEELEKGLSDSIATAGATDFKKQAPYFIDYLKEQLASLYSPHDLASLGLSIYTTLDTQVQLAAERALERGLTRLEHSNPAINRQDPKEKIQGAVVVIQPKTGYIIAMAGGRDYGVSQFNRATQARRQPGSAFKPFVYLSYLDRVTPASRISNKPVAYQVNGEPWEPRNFRPIPDEYLSVRDALSRSVNIATVNLAMDSGLGPIIEMAAAFQFSTRFKAVPSLSLGAFEVVPLELARAYCAFAADGLLPYPLSLKEVVDERGTTLERRHMMIDNAISPAKSYVMTSLLRSVVTDGTASSLKEMGISFPVAGKTGTTNDFRDAWFIGYTPTILALIWVGFDNEASTHAPGSTAAMPIWAELVKAIPQYTSGEWFEAPPGVVKRVICPDSGELAVRTCPHWTTEIFLEENAPKQRCTHHISRDRLRQIWDNGKAIINNW